MNSTANIDIKYHTIIEAVNPWKPFNFTELLQYKDMFYFMIVNGYKAQQKQTVLGYFWVIFSPVANILFFSIVFGKVAKIDTGDIPYVVFNASAVVGWTYLSGSMSGAVSGLMSQSHLIQKVYFPRIFIPVIPTIIGLANLSLNLIITLILLATFNYYPNFAIIMIIPIIIIMILFSSGLGLLLSTFTLQYRDLGSLWGYFMRFFIYAVPLAYPISAVPSKYQLLYLLNPAAAVIEGFRAALLNTPMPWGSLMTAAGTSLTIFYIGAVIFRLREPNIVDAL